jgi:hypothetical protein
LGEKVRLRREGNGVRRREWEGSEWEGMRGGQRGEGLLDELIDRDE